MRLVYFLLTSHTLLLINNIYINKKIGNVISCILQSHLKTLPKKIINIMDTFVLKGFCKGILHLY